MKTEMYHQQTFEAHLAARTAVMNYIETWYNWFRLHAQNAGLSPAAVLTEYLSLDPPMIEFCQ